MSDAQTPQEPQEEPVREVVRRIRRHVKATAPIPIPAPRPGESAEEHLLRTIFGGGPHDPVEPTGPLPPRAPEPATRPPDPDLAGLIFERAEADPAPEGEAVCDRPDCGTCRFRHALRRMVGSLVEAAQEATRADAAMLEVWQECTDPTCRYEVTAHMHLAEVLMHVQEAFDAAAATAGMWRALPEGWLRPEMAGLSEVYRVARILGARAQAHDRRRRRGTWHP